MSRPVEWLKASQLFLSVVQSGSLSAAARHAGLSPASVSRLISALEENVGARLLNRTSRNMTLTEAGEIYHGKLEQILTQISEANDSVARLQTSPRGTLRVHSRILVGNHHIVPALSGFLARFPEVKVDLTMSNYAIDLIEQKIDVDIRIGKLNDSSLIARKLASAKRVVCASAGYLARRPAIQRPMDLTEQDCLCYRLHQGRSIWRFIDQSGHLSEVPVSGPLQSDNGQSLYTLALAGSGVALLPDWCIAGDLESGALIQLFPEYQVSHEEFDNGVYALFQHSRQIPGKIRVFIDYLANYFKERFE